MTELIITAVHLEEIDGIITPFTTVTRFEYDDEQDVLDVIEHAREKSLAETKIGQKGNDND